MLDEPDPPSPEFIRLVSAFRAEMYSWVLECKRGTPRAKAWPKDDRQRTLGAMIEDRGYLLSFRANPANLVSELMNPDGGGTSADGNCGSAGAGLGCDEAGASADAAGQSC